MTIPVTTSKGEFLFVKLPHKGLDELIAEVKGTLIGIHPGLSEEQAAEIVETTSSLWIRYKDYMGESDLSSYKTALQSLATLMQANRIYTKNPYGEKPKLKCPHCQDTGSQDEFTGCQFCNPGYEWKSTETFEQKLNKRQEAEERTSKY